MCPPVSVRSGDEGVSYLRASWMYQLRHGDQLGICFACFKAAFLELRDSLESEDWEEGDWDPEPTDPAGAGPEQGWGPGVGLSWGQGQGHPAQEGSVEWGSAPPPPRGRRRRARTTTSRPPSWSLRTQHPGAWALRTLTGPRASPGGCAHWPRPPAPWQGLLRVDLPPGEPTVLELGTTRAVDPAEAEAWLRDPQRLSVAGCCDAVYLRKTTRGGSCGKSWKVLESAAGAR